jgi:uncharacterized membrane protein (UPF0136 family)
MDNKEKTAWFVVAIIFIYSIYTALNYSSIALNMSSGTYWNAMMIYVFMNISYLAIIGGTIYFYKNNGLKGIVTGLIVGLLLTASFDILSSPRCKINADSIEQGCGDGITSATNSDTYTLKAVMNIGIPYKYSAMFYYIFLPSILLILAGWIGGVVELNRRFKSMLR